MILGEGSYGKVYECENTITGDKFAIKKLGLELFEKDKYLRKQIVQEIEILNKLKHVNIVRFVELLQTKKALYIVTEMCRDGDLKQLIQKKTITERHAINIMAQIVKGFRELVDKGVIHRDMKPANVLNDQGIVKIADFGYAKYVENYSTQLLKSCVGSPLYMAPQVLDRKTYGTKCDIWSLGVIFYEMIFYKTPWMAKDEKELLSKIKTEPFQLPGEITEFSIHFLNISLKYNEEERATWQEVFKHFDEIQDCIFQEDAEEEQIQKLPQWINKLKD